MPVILGGGISGISAAYYLSKKGINSTKLFEASKRVGGWIQTNENVDFLFETGPRTIRPAGIKGKNTLNLIEEIGLTDQIVPITKDHIAAKNRMLYVNGQLCPLPSSFGGLFKKLPPFSKPLIFSVLRDLRAAPAKVHDESIYSFFERRFGTEMAKYAISSMICGICAGNAKEISVKFLMEDIFNNEQKYGGVIKGAIMSMLNTEKANKKIEPPSDIVKKSIQDHWRIYSFKNGMETLPTTLAANLNDNISFNASCDKIVFNKNNIEVRINGKETVQTNHLISSIPSYKLSSLLKPQHPELAAELQQIPYVDVAVVNLQYDKDDLLKLPAFGFLVPPSENLPILGVIYDSCCFDMKGKTVLTIMMGGAWFREKFGINPKETDLLNVAVGQIRNILKIEQEPNAMRVQVLKNCIPQYVVGHHDRVQRIREYIRQRKLPLSLCGAAYDGVGLNDVIYSARQCVDNNFS